MLGFTSTHFFFQIRILIHILSYFCIFKNKLCNVLPIYSEWKLELTVLGLGSAGDSRTRRVGRSSVQKRKKRKNNILIKYSLMCHRRICACKNIVTLLQEYYTYCKHVLFFKAAQKKKKMERKLHLTSVRAVKWPPSFNCDRCLSPDTGNPDDRPVDCESTRHL